NCMNLPTFSFFGRAGVHHHKLWRGAESQGGYTLELCLNWRALTTLAQHVTHRLILTYVRQKNDGVCVGARCCLDLAAVPNSLIVAARYADGCAAPVEK